MLTKITKYFQVSTATANQTNSAIELSEQEMKAIAGGAQRPRYAWFGDGLGGQYGG